ncbi:MAG TPA: isochorismate synthase [Dermatophilaceae bacterium]|nr:isochorismate synthase [Dermatophilaceae bacterium]
MGPERSASTRHPPVAQSVPALVARTVEVADPGPLLDLVPGQERPELVSAWVRRGQGLVGWGRAATYAASGPDRFKRASRWWRELVERSVVRNDVRLPGTGPVAFGSFSFADASLAGSALVVPETVVGHRDGRWWVTTVGVGDHLPPPPRLARASRPAPPREVTFADGALTAAEWAGAVGRAVQRITAGELDKVVLARDLMADAEQPVDPRWLLGELAREYDTTWVFAVDGLVGATPEMLVRLEKGLVTSRVLAGTIRRTGHDASDLALAGSLARSSKDLEEHEYAVRSVAEALAPHCLSMYVPEAPFVLHLANVMHLATDVAGVLRNGFGSLRLAAALHPSAAVCGTPTAVAAEAIAGLEGMDRGRYAGPVGWMDAGGDGDWGIALRCGAFDPADARRLRLFAGCGIVAGSDPAAELAEADAKLVPMRDALSAG